MDTIRLQRARQSLEGLSVADALGGFFEFWLGRYNEKYLNNRSVPDGMWRYTDDTEMALSIYRQLREFGEIRQDDLAQSFVQYFDSSRGYGVGAKRLIDNIQTGGYWRDLAPNMFRGEGSYGNGAAMRSAPIGAYFADDMNALIVNARLASEVTHAHPEGIAGGIAIAVASSVAVSYRGQAKPSIAEIISKVIKHIPESEVLDNCITAHDISGDIEIMDVATILGNGRHVAAMDTVPIALWTAAKWLDDFVEGCWQLISIGGDVDTTCAIMGGIVASYSVDSIPQKWIDHREQLPDWALMYNGSDD